MNKTIKTFAAGIITGALIFSLPALARDVYESITVVRNTIGVTIDGQKCLKLVKSFYGESGK